MSCTSSMLVFLCLVGCTTSKKAAAPSETAVFAAGCFWSVELVFARVEGVVETRYSGVQCLCSILISILICIGKWVSERRGTACPLQMLGVLPRRSRPAQHTTDSCTNAKHLQRARCSSSFANPLSNTGAPYCSVGYIGGTLGSPKYEDVVTGKTGALHLPWLLSQDGDTSEQKGHPPHTPLPATHPLLTACLVYTHHHTRSTPFPGHAEAVQVVYDPSTVPFSRLVRPLATPLHSRMRSRRLAVVCATPRGGRRRTGAPKSLLPPG